jgi:SOS-response transcriptional repressor LexA
VNVKGLLLRELAEGMTEKELALAIGVSQGTLEHILAGTFPEDPATWEQLASYFRMNVDVLRTGGSTHSITILNLSDHAQQSAVGLVRKIPLLDWQQLSEMCTTTSFPDVIHAEATLDTVDIAGKRAFALKVPDDSMETMFSQGEIIFVDPDREWGPGDYVIAHHANGAARTVLLRQVQTIGDEYGLHPLNRKYNDLPFTKQDKVCGKVIRLTKDIEPTRS